jgi:hypothetical protein
MTTIQTASSTPPHISDFMNKHMEKLMEIYEEGISREKFGCLGMKCSQKENKIDVFFTNEEMLLKMLAKESFEQLKETMENKKLFLIQELDMNSIFLVYL